VVVMEEDWLFKSVREERQDKPERREYCDFVGHLILCRCGCVVDWAETVKLRVKLKLDIPYKVTSCS